MTVVCNCWCRIHHVTHVNVHGGTKKKSAKKKNVTGGGSRGEAPCLSGGRTDENITDNKNWLDAPAIPQHLLFFSFICVHKNSHHFYFFFTWAQLLVTRLEKVTPRIWKRKVYSRWLNTTLSPLLSVFENLLLSGAAQQVYPGSFIFEWPPSP